MPIFTQQLRKIDVQNPTEAIREMARHIKYLQDLRVFCLGLYESLMYNEAVVC